MSHVSNSDWLTQFPAALILILTLCHDDLIASVMGWAHPAGPASSRGCFFFPPWEWTAAVSWKFLTWCARLISGGWSLLLRFSKVFTFLVVLLSRWGQIRFLFSCTFSDFWSVYRREAEFRFRSCLFGGRDQACQRWSVFSTVPPFSL